MKKTSKYALALLIAGLGFFNLKSSATATNQNRISLTENFASADDEGDGDEEGLAKYKERESTHTTGTTTIVRAGKPNCTQEWESDDVNCLGTGTLKCKPSHNPIVTSSDCGD